MAQLVKTMGGLAIASVKTVNDLAIASVKTVAGLDNTSSFFYSSVVFDGTNDYLSKGSDFTGISDGSQGLISFWIKEATNFDDHIILRSSGGFFDVRRHSSNELRIRMFSSGGTELLSLSSSIGLGPADGWVNVIASWDLNQANASWIYMNGVDQTTRNIHLSGTIDYTSGAWGLGAREDTGGLKFQGLLCEFYFTNSFLDISMSSNRLKFRSSGGVPENLGSDGSAPTGVQPILYLHNAVPLWQINLGGGGNFSEIGTLVDGGSDKP